MNGPHDMGGFTGFGPVVAETDEPVFHSAWERRTFALNLAVGMNGMWNIDEARHARELLEPLRYWSSSYYEYRHYALEKQLLALGMATAEELETGRMTTPSVRVTRVVKAEDIPATLNKGGPADRPCNRPQLFKIGDKVRARMMTPEGHTRLVRYVRGRVGEIVRVHGTHVLPDSSARGKGDDPQWLYAVQFSARELWGKDNRDSVCIDLWEPYLEPMA